RVHDAIGVFGAVSVATACLVRGSVAYDVAGADVSDREVLDIEHPSGHFSVTLDVTSDGDTVDVHHAALMRTARLLMRGDVFIPSSVWSHQ
ncbi:MAG TPA: PrpF domain-containing protein, partial [Acidimicrobiales bacterium]